MKKKVKAKGKKGIFKRFKKWQKILFIILLLIALILIGLIIHKVCAKYLFNDETNDKVETVIKEELDLDNYNYYINSSATKYEKELFDELKKVLSTEEVNEEDYAKALSKLFVCDLFSLSSKNNSSDITSSQYVYDSYQETYEAMVKDTIYANIELNLAGERNQKLATVTNVEVTSLERGSFTLNGKVLDSEAFIAKVNIKYESDLGYPDNYKITLVKNNELLQVVKAEEI